MSDSIKQHRVMLTSGIRTFVKDSKEEMIYKSYVEKVLFLKFQCIKYTIFKNKFFCTC